MRNTASSLASCLSVSALLRIFPLVIVSIACLHPGPHLHGQTYPERSGFDPFDLQNDILIAQFDCLADTDDVHSMAALGSMLAHSSLNGINVFGVLGATGRQSDNIPGGDDQWTPEYYIIAATQMMSAIFGNEWTHAWDGDGGVEGTNWEASIKAVVAQVEPVLQAGGKVWVMEGGQSNITRGWLDRLRTRSNGLSDTAIQNNVFVVQHSQWNQNQTTPTYLSNVQSWSTYAKIHDGNRNNNINNNKTPGWRTTTATFLNEAQSNANPNGTAKAYWTLAEQIVQTSPYTGNAEINAGGVDFSDCSEAWWILDLESILPINGGNLDADIRQFWDRYVVNVPGDNLPVIDPAALPGAVVGESYNATLSSLAGDAPFTWNVSAGSLPAGLVLNSGTGVISGSPTVLGTSSFTVRVVDGDGDVATQAKSITVSGDGYFNETNGLVIMEAESTTSSLQHWRKINPGDPDYVSGATGTGQLEFTGNTPNGGSPLGPLVYRFKINTPGDYQIDIRSRKRLDGARDDQCNDCYIQMAGDFTKGATQFTEDDLRTPHKFFGAGEFNWEWTYRMETHEVSSGIVRYKFKAGEIYTLTVWGRSQRYNIDRIVLKHSATYARDYRAASEPESPIVGDNTPPPPPLPIVVNALDFTDITSGDVPYYRDTARNALAIDASVVANRDRFAEAQTVFPGVAGTYDLTIRALGERDGECSYRLYVDGSLIGEQQNAPTGTDYVPQDHVFRNVALSANSVIVVSSNNVSNGVVPEDGGFAYARGRWTSLTIDNASGTVPVVDSFALINGETGLPVPGYEAMTGSVVIDTGAIGTANFNLRANTTPDSDFGSVALDLSGPIVSNRTDNSHPWDLFSGSGEVFAAGSYSLSATPYSSNDGGGSAGTPVSLNLTVEVPLQQSPFGGSPGPIPGRIEAEDYDLGGPDIAYSDTSANNLGGAYRTDQVDITTTIDVGGGHYLGWLRDGEWTEYTVNVAEAGNYRIDLRVAARTSRGICHLEMDGVDVTGPISIPNTGDVEAWTNVTLRNIPLQAGQQVLRFAVDTDGFNLNWIEFQRERPYSGTPLPIPGRIEVENYDFGGEGVAYSDTTVENQGGVYRTDGVDVQTPDDNPGSYYYVGYVAEGEWLEYTVNVSKNGYYSIRFHVASRLSGRSLHLEAEGANVTGSVPVTDTDGWEIWDTVSVDRVYLNAGEQVLRLVADTPSFNIDWIEIAAVDEDGDWIDDSWEELHFGSRLIDGSIDSDGDGIDDFFEFLGDTNPRVHDNHGFKVVAGRDSNGLHFRWSTAPGRTMGRDYIVLISEDLVAWRQALPDEYTYEITTVSGKEEITFRLTDQTGTQFLTIGQPDSF